MISKHLGSNESLALTSFLKKSFHLALGAVVLATLAAIGGLPLADREIAAQFAGLIILMAFVTFALKNLTAALCLLFFMQPLDSIVRSWMGGRFLTFAYGSLFLILLHALKPRSIRVLVHTPVRYYLLLLLWAALSYMWATDAWGWINEVAILVGTTCAICLAPLVFRHRAVLRYIMLSYVIGALLCLVIFVLIYAEAKHGYLATHRNIASGEVARVWAVAILMAVYLMRSASRRWKVGCGVAIGALLTGCLVNTNRGALIALAAAFGVTLLFQKGLFKKAGSLCLLALLTWGAFSIASELTPANIEYRLNRTLSTDADFATSGRTAIWRAALLGAQNYPLTGVGAGNFLDRFSELYEKSGERYHRSNDPKSTHSVYIATLVELGSPGLALLMIFLLKMLHEAWRIPSSDRNHALGWVTFAIVGFAVLNVRDLQLFWLMGIAIYLRSEAMLSTPARPKQVFRRQAHKLAVNKLHRIIPH